MKSKLFIVILGIFSILKISTVFAQLPPNSSNEVNAPMIPSVPAQDSDQDGICDAMDCAPTDPGNGDMTEQENKDPYEGVPTVTLPYKGTGTQKNNDDEF